jgi:methyl-accepting chemotaxis protein
MIAPALNRPAAHEPKAVRGRSAVQEWKRQVTWFATAMAVLMMLVAGGSAAAMWHVLASVARGEQLADERAQAAVAARIAVLDVDRLLLQAIAETDAAKSRAAAVASISAASRLEDAITALLQAVPASSDAAEMRRLVEMVKVPRVNIIVLARKGERAQAMEALEGIADPLHRIDAVSAGVLEAESVQRRRAAQERAELFARMVYGLLASAAASFLVGFVFYRRLMRRFARIDQVEQLLEEVAQSAGQLDADGKQLHDLNTEVRRANDQLGLLLEEFHDSRLAMTHEATQSLKDLNQLGQTCEASAGTSRQHAQEAAVVAQRIHSTNSRMHQLLDSTHALERSRSEIADFAEQIAGISSMTRLLSLNAAVEAARAGEAGRGFAVIAGSVRQLSENTQQAAVQIRRASEDITRQLKTTGEAVQQASALMDECAGRVAGLDTSARSSQTLVDGMAAGVQGFRGSFERQVDRIEAMDRESQGLDQALHDGRRHAGLLDATSRALGETSTALLRRLSSLQE